MLGVIYRITNIVNGKSYVGQTTGLVSTRWAVHKSEARRRPKCYFHKAIAKYGESAWSLEILQQCDSYDELNRAEHVWILAHRTYEQSRGYNLTMGGENGVCTEEARLNMRRAQAHRAPVSSATKAKMSHIRKGRPHSREHVIAQADAQRGKKIPAHVKAAVSAANRQRVVSDQMREKCRQASLRRWHGDKCQTP